MSKIHEYDSLSLGKNVFKMGGCNNFEKIGGAPNR